MLKLQFKIAHTEVNKQSTQMNIKCFNFISTAQLKKALIAHSNPKAPNSYCLFTVGGKKTQQPQNTLYSAQEILIW